MFDVDVMFVMFRHFNAETGKDKALLMIRQIRVCRTPLFVFSTFRAFVIEIGVIGCSQS